MNNYLTIQVLQDNYKPIISYPTNPIYDGNTVAWYVADASNTMTLNDVSVARWNDKLGSGHDLIQNTGAKQPKWGPGGVLFDGSNDFMATADFPLVQPCSFYVAMQMKRLTGLQDLIMGNTYWSPRILTNSTTLLADILSRSTISRVIDTSTLIFRAVLNGTKSKLQRDSCTASLGTIGGRTGMNGICLGSYYTDTAEWANVEFKEIIARKKIDDPITESYIYGYLNEKYLNGPVNPSIGNYNLVIDASFAIPNPLYDGNTVAWYTYDASYIEKDSSNYISAWYDKSKYSLGAELAGSLNLTTWSSFQSPTVTSSSVTSTNTLTCGVYKNFFEVGKTYKVIISGDVSIATGSLVINNGFSSRIELGSDLLSSFNQTYVFTAVYTQLYLQLKTPTVIGDSITINSLSIKEVSGNILTQRNDTTRPLDTSDGILFDGINDSLRASFTFNQPEMIYAVFRQPSWINTEILLDGFTTNSGLLQQESVSPKLRMTTGTIDVKYQTLPLNTYGIVRMLFNGYKSKFQINNDAPSLTGGGETYTSMSGIKLGTNSINYGNVEFKEIILRKVQDFPQNETYIYNYLKNKYGL